MVIKINKFFARLQPTEAREQNGLKTETVQGTFGVGKEPINSAEIENFLLSGTWYSNINIGSRRPKIEFIVVVVVSTEMHLVVI